MQNLGSFCPLGAILGAPSHTKLDFAIPLFKRLKQPWKDKRRFIVHSDWNKFSAYPPSESFDSGFFPCSDNLLQDKMFWEKVNCSTYIYIFVCLQFLLQGKVKFQTEYRKENTPCPQKNLTVCFLVISQLLLGQIQKVR